MLFLCVPVVAQVNVLTYHNNNSRTGENLNETILTPANVNSLTFGKLFAYNVDGHVFAQPLYVSGLNVPGQGTHNVILIATEHNSVYAFDADSNTGPTGGLLWRTNLGPPAPTPNNDFGNRYGPFNLLGPEVGITGTPVVDLASSTLYVDAFTHEGSNYFHRIHALSITNGAEQAHSPVLVSASMAGSGVGGTNGVVVFDPKQHIQRCALTLAGRILYVAYAGYSDTNPYHGWVLGFDPVTLQQLTNYIFNTTPNSTVAAFRADAGEGGIWMGGGGLAVDANTNLYFEIGNGIFTATNNSGGTEYGDSFIKLSASNGLAVADYFTPYNQASLAAGDLDVGSGGLVLLADQPGNFPHLLAGASKEGKIYLINRDMMTTGNNHYDPTNNVDHIVQTLTGKITRSFDTPVYFSGTIYYAGSGDKLKAFSLTNGLLSTDAVSVGPRTFGFPGATPSLSANGTNNGIIWAVQMGSPGVLAAYNATNLTTEIYNSTQSGSPDQLTNGTKFAVPTIANGKVYVGGQYAVSVFGLISTNPPYITSQPTGGTVVASDDFAFLVGANGAQSYQWRRAGVAIPGAINVTYRLFDVKTDDSGTYTVVLTNSFGSVTSTPAVLDVTPAPTYATYRAAVFSDAPIHYYPLDDTNGTSAADLGSLASGGGTYTGGFTLGQPSATTQIGTCVHCDGQPGTFVNLGLLHPGDSVAVEAWVNLDPTARTNSYNSFVCRWDGSYELDFAGNGSGDFANFDVRNNSNIFGMAVGASSSTRGAWHHVVGVFTNGIVTIYVDGVQGSVMIIGGVLRNAGPTPDRVLIGATRNGTSSSFNFKGYLDEVAIYDHALSLVKIRAHLRASQPPPELLTIQPTLILTWPAFPSGYVLQFATDSGGPYQDYTGTIYRAGQDYNAPLTPPGLFFRLMKP